MTTAFVFPGQGAQTVGMGRDLYEQSPAARAIFDQADAALGLRLTQLCFEGPEETLTATENAQPALLTMSVALLAALADSVGIVPFVAQRAVFVAGHSLGEYSALVAAGALDFASAVRLVRRRGELMSAANQGGMAAIIGLEVPVLEEVCAAAATNALPVVIANYNSPGQLVISGATQAIERACALAKERGAKRALPLKVSAAFHSPLMQAASDGLASAVCDVEIRPAQVPVVSNVNATPLREAADIQHELVAQVTAPVRWIESVQYMAAVGVDTFVEIGAGNILTGLIKRIVTTQLVNVNDLASVHQFGEQAKA